MTQDQPRPSRTTDAIRSAPHGAVYVWCNDCLDYPKSVAARLGRADLRILPVSVLGEGGIRLSGLARPVVVDHAVRRDCWVDGMARAAFVNSRAALG